MRPFEYIRATSRAEALSEIAGTDPIEVLLWSGGTALIHLIKQGMIKPKKLIDVGSVADLDGIKARSDGLALGAGVRLRALETSAVVGDKAPSLAQVVSQIGNIRVRHAARLGGYIAHADPAGDLAPVLLVMDAMVELQKLQDRRTVELSKLYVDLMETTIDAGEMVTSVFVPSTSSQRHTLFVKYAPRSRDDYATVTMAVSVAFDHGMCREARIAGSGIGSTPMRFPEAEACLFGRELNEFSCREAGEVVGKTCRPWDDDRGSAGYKQAMARVWTERLLWQIGRVHGRKQWA